MWEEDWEKGVYYRKPKATCSVGGHRWAVIHSDRWLYFMSLLTSMQTDKEMHYLYGVSRRTLDNVSVLKVQWNGKWRIDLKVFLFLLYFLGHTLSLFFFFFLVREQGLRHPKKLSHIFCWYLTIQPRQWSGNVKGQKVLIDQRSIH